jgi:PmbA protein
MDTKRLAQRAVEQAQHWGAFMAEAFILDAKSLTIEVASGTVETLKLAEDNGIGIRTITKNGQMGFAFSSDLSEPATEQAVRQSLVNAEKTFPDPYNRLPETLKEIPHLRTIDPAIQQVTIDEKISMAQKLENATISYDSRIKRVERAVYEDGDYGVTLANSNGLLVHYRSGYCGLYTSALAEENGDNQSGHGMQYSRDYQDLNPVFVGEEAAQDAVRLLGASSIATQRATLILSPYIATTFLEVLISALAADAVQKGKSLFTGKVGAQVAASTITLIDDGRLEGGIASSPVDAEGVPTSRTILIQDGILKGFLHNTYTAAKDNTMSTGNGMRSTFKSTPEVGPTNIFIHSGTMKESELIQEIKAGFYVTSVMGMHTANPISGDFSVGAAGIWVENGKMTKAIRGVAIAGNMLELLRNIDAAADNLRFFGGQGAPTLRIQGMSISGS